MLVLRTMGWYTMDYDNDVGFLYDDANNMLGLGKCKIQ